MINLNETSRNDITTSLKKLKLTGMVDSYDEILSIAIKRQSTLPFVLYELLKSEIKTRKLKAIKTQMTAARFPKSKDLHDFIFTDTPINSEQVMNLYGCGFVRTARTIILVGGTGQEQEQEQASLIWLSLLLQKPYEKDSKYASLTSWI